MPISNLIHIPKHIMTASTLEENDSSSIIIQSFQRNKLIFLDPISAFRNFKIVGKDLESRK